MNLEFKEWVWVQWNEDLSLGVLAGTKDWETVSVAFGATDLAELFGVPPDSDQLREAVAEDREFLEKIARGWIRAGRLDEDGSLYLRKEDLLPYFTRRAATARA